MGGTFGRTRLLVAAGGLAAALCALGGVAAYAAVSQPAQHGVFNGCYQRQSGLVRLLTNQRPRCGKHEVAIEWNQGGSPLTVGVDSFGNHASGTADVSVAHPKTGKYVITFNDQSQLSARGTIDCAATATLSRGMSGAFNSDLFDAPPGEISTFPGFGANFPTADQVVVNTYDSAGNPHDQSFWLVLNC
jgi:opacity protein-like surface antigen